MYGIFRNSTHINEKSHDCLIGNINGRIIKITYEAYNAQEKCNTELFDGNKWNHILSMLDMGILPENSAYIIWDLNKRQERANQLINKSATMCYDIILNHTENNR
jgi:hypothetical protein